MEPRFLNASTVIESLRDNGYTNTAYALAEIIDNSIQANASRVEIGFIEEKLGGTPSRSTYNVSEITVWDNGKGMSPSELRQAMQFGGSTHKLDPDGMGKFGMGLPNSSISQCRRVDVWSWTEKSLPHHTYLDIDEMKDGLLEVVPEPSQKNIPQIYQTSFFQQLPKSGTLVIWSKLDRLNWKTGHSNFKHCEHLVGRMYRQYLSNERVKIDSITYRKSGPESIEEYKREPFSSNDPMYLLKNTSLPSLPGKYKGEAFFELLDEEEVPIEFFAVDEKLVKGTVVIRTSIVKSSIAKYILEHQKGNKRLGQTVWGKDCAKNIGVSVMRAGRELVLRDSFLNSELRRYKGRYLGIEVQFPPALDAIFGVTNNKQDAVKFVPYEIAELSDQAGFESEQEYLDDLKENNDPLLCTLEVVKAIKRQVKHAEEKLKLVAVDRNDYDPDSDAPYSAGQRATRGSQVREERGDRARDNSMPNETELEELLKQEGMTEEEAQKKAESALSSGERYLIETAPKDSDAFFDVSTRKGMTLVLFNSNHIFYRRFISQLPEEQLVVMQTVIAGFARVMNETSDDRRLTYLNTIRRDWGKVITDFLDDSDTDDEIF
ncbi:hypothetical protein IDSA_06700 [Pseudidiomarina salinarum]|uniref:ATP-binding protein n=1 Tax=Pseudidiomarina salinarum TaxID=435908 RepID=A0A094JE02_9GAMM|nr:ATP-binding protein [Pseudidiomarina salinarum]KFZ30776.1 hypothetical protein IDSA_06700 [Pseudidiomarina salinarum]RUO71242.1 ATP-binding protein [Pseudidiomarina salinarum]